MEDSPLEIFLSRDAQQFIVRESTALGFASASAYVESLVRAARQSVAKDRAEQMVLEGVASGEPIVADEAFWARLRTELNSRIRYPKTA